MSLNNISIDWLGSWFDDNKVLVENLNAQVNLVVKNTGTEKPAHSYNIETSRYIARTSLWESGECDVDAIAKENPDGDRFYAYQIISSEIELNEFLQRFIPLL